MITAVKAVALTLFALWSPVTFLIAIVVAMCWVAQA